MALATWSAPDGVGYSKKHDAPANNYNAGHSRPVLGTFRRRRLILVFMALVALYFFVKNIPTDVPRVSDRYNPDFGSMASGHTLAHQDVQQSKEAGVKEIPGPQYEGTVQFHNLASSLRPHLLQDSPNNVLFLFPDLLSTSALVSFACQMAQNNRSSIHVAILGSQDIDSTEILKIHGMYEKDCPVFWHDARPDHFMESSSSRIETSIKSGFMHCSVALRPHLVIVDERFNEKSPTGMQLLAVAANTRTLLLTIPRDIQQSLPWISTLDSQSLSKLQEVEVEVVIQAYSESAGSLIRLLRSIESANYDGFYFPRLTIELPTHIDPFVIDYLQRFRWPPNSPPSASRLTIRRNVDARKLNSASASLQTIQSFYPRSLDTSHVLLLSPDAELSPGYFHYLLLALLEYKYSRTNENWSHLLFGISLEMPGRRLDGHAPFITSLPDKEPLVLSQTPNSNAVLVTGESWRNLHTFLTERLIRDPDLTYKSDSATTITNTYPGWLGEALSLVQARGQYILYPAFATNKNLRLVTLHRELHQMPEEHIPANPEKKQTKFLDTDNIMHNDVLTGETDLSVGNDNAAPISNTLPMQVLLPQDRKSMKRALPAFSEIPLYDFVGEPTDWSRSSLAALKFSDDFSLRHGSCSSLEARKQTDQGLVGYLFCETG